MTAFDPNAACAPNENYFGFPFPFEQCPLVLVPMPWEVTTSYRAGTALGPEAIRKASVQLDFFDFEIPAAWEMGIGTYPFPESAPIARLSEQARPVARKLIDYQEGKKSFWWQPISCHAERSHPGNQFFIARYRTR